jgi:apolipoprotein N-acyltransferase
MRAVIRLSPPLVLAALALGAAHALSFAPWNLPWLQLIALAALFSLAQRAYNPRQAAWLGFGFGLGWFGVGVSWVYVSMHEYGQMPAPLAGIATTAFCAFLALYPALALGVAQWLSPAARARRLLLALPAAWAASEWLRGVLLTGFPWLASGYAHSDGPLAGFAPLVGVYGISWLAAFVAGCAALLVDRRGVPMRTLVAAGLAGAGLLVGGQILASETWTTPVGAPLRVRLVQGNVPQDLKFADGGLERSVAAYAGLLKGDPVDLTVLPESVFPLPIDMLPDTALQAVLEPTRDRGKALVFGIFIEQPRGHYYNSAVGVAPAADGKAPLQRYSKRHLVPFGEFIPPGFRWFVDLMHMPIGDQQRGAPYQGPMDLAGQRIAVNICYEDLFGAEIIRAWDVPERAPTLLLNLSNLAWFNDSLALPQHLQVSRLRARETGRPMLRATNTGATAVIDPRGQVVALAPFNRAVALDAQIRGYEGTTPYVRYGDRPVLVALGLLLALAALWRRRAA